MPGPASLVRDDAGKQWYVETLHSGFRTSYLVKEVLFDSNTPHQRLIVADTAAVGRLVALDGVTQVTTADEHVYHEMLSHVPILAHGSVSEVLIIGGGDGGMAEEVFKHRSVKRVVMVEIDPGVIDFAKTHLADVHKGCFDDPRLEVVIADGKDYAATSKDRFDLIIIDSTDPIGPGEVLFTSSFYGDCKRMLKPGGVLVTQNGVPFFQPDELRNTVFNFSRLFADAGCYLAVVPTYVGGFMALGWGTDNLALRKVALPVVEKRYRDAGLKTRYYTPELHKAAFVLPAFIGEIVDGARKSAGK
ncbi:MAG: polyamine aminopropyltransferase [Parvibaculaceae bacterium]